MNARQYGALIAMGIAAGLLFGGVENFWFGLVDNWPMLVVMLAGLDAEKGLGKVLAGFRIPAAYLATGAAISVNSFTDYVAGLADPSTSSLGVLAGCLIVLPMLYVTYKLRSVRG